MLAHRKPFYLYFNAANGCGDTVPDTTTLVSVRIGFVRTSLGLTLVAATAKGLRSVLFGSTNRSLESDFSRRFPSAQLVPGDAVHQELAERIGQLIDGPDTTLKVELDLMGSDFEQRVWMAIRDVPVGSTASYTDIARAVGPDATAQDVAAACATNPLAVVIPCHRIVRKDGSLAGYRWGVARKRDLLDREQAFAAAASETTVVKSGQRLLSLFDPDDGSA